MNNFEKLVLRCLVLILRHYFWGGTEGDRQLAITLLIEIDKELEND